MKKEVIIACILVIILAVFGTVTNNTQQKKVKEEQNRYIQEKEACAVNYHEPGEIEDYNYIINPTVLKDYNLNVEACTTLNDDVNDYLHTIGIANSKLKLVNFNRKLSLTTFNVIVETDENVVLLVQYDEKAGNYTIIEEQ